MGSQQQWQRSTYHLGSSTITLLVGSHLCKGCLLGNKWAVSSSGSAVHTIWAAVPSNIWAASSWALSTITLLVGSHLGKGCLLGYKWAVSSSGSILLGTQCHHIACWQPSLQGLSSWQQMG